MQKNHPETSIGSYPKFDGKSFSTDIVIRARDARSLGAAEAGVIAMIEAIGSSPQKKTSPELRGRESLQIAVLAPALALALSASLRYCIRHEQVFGGVAVELQQRLSPQRKRAGVRHVSSRRKPFLYPGISFTVTPAPWPGGLADNGPEWRAMVCITRGGLVPAAIVSRELTSG